jgi:ferric-dicitrate binding protein FerR (iron transport regulator)
MASYLSEESKEKPDVHESLEDEKGQLMEKYWKNMGKPQEKEMPDVDKAWSTLYNRLEEDQLIGTAERKSELINVFLRVAAVIIVLVSLTFTGKYIISGGKYGQLTTISTSIGEKNRIVNLPDGSEIYLNRNSSLEYPEKFRKNSRKVKLSGEAFFDISPDSNRPFIIDAGKAKVQVVGTSFNIITSNQSDEVEVFVKTGKVILMSNDGDRSIALDPGFKGVINGILPSKSLNDDPNYLSWNTGEMIYDGTILDKVFYDLQRVHNINVEVTDDSILDETLSTVFDNDSPDTIIRLICTAFSLKFEKKDEVYYLSR